MAKILIAFFCGTSGERMPAFYESLIDGLNRNGNDLLIYSHHTFCGEFGDAPENIQEEIRKFQPDIAFLFNNAFYDISEVVNCPIVVYEVDSPLYYSNWDRILAKKDRYNFLVTQTESILYLQKKGIMEEQIIQLPFFSEIVAEELEKKSNISFIGSMFTNNNTLCLNHFVSENPSQKEIHQYKMCAKMLIDDPFAGKEQLFLQIPELTDKVKMYFDPQQIIMAVSDEYRMKILSRLHELDLRIYGTPNWGSKFFFDMNINFDFVAIPICSVSENQFIYNSSKIGISIAHKQAKSGFPWRVMDIMASNACLVTDYHSSLLTCFPGVPIQIYKDANEAYEICKKLIENEAMREDIVLKCQECINENYRLIHHLKRLEDAFGVILLCNE